MCRGKKPIISSNITVSDVRSWTRIYRCEASGSVMAKINFPYTALTVHHIDRHLAKEVQVPNVDRTA